MFAVTQGDNCQMNTIPRLAAAALVLFVVVGCAKKKTDSDAEQKKTEAVTTPADTAGDPEATPSASEKLSASHILIMHKDSERAPKEVTRTKEEALALAKDILGKLKAGKDFAELAKQHSDCPSKAQGGDLGTFPPDAMAPEFTKGVLALKDGEISSAPVESSFGYHIIKRQEVIPPEKLSASLIVVLHKDSQPNPNNETRTLEDAKKRAEEALTKIKNGADFGEIAKEYSDHPSKVGGGSMGNFESDTVPPQISKAVSGLKIGEVTPELLVTPLGFHILKRQELLESVPMAASLILVMHKDSEPNIAKATRTKKQALARAKQAIAKLKKGADFAEVAKEFSDHPNKANDGDMGMFMSDRMMPTIVDALKPLKIGEITNEPIDIPIGYHVMRRNDPKPTPPPAPAPSPVPAPAPVPK